MDTRLLNIFRAVAKHNGLANAALELHLTPSALSHAIKSLETELGCRLFDRVGGKMMINQAGEQLLAAIAEPLRALDNAAAALRELGRWGQGRLRVGAPVTACQYVLPEVLRELRREFPKLLMQVETGNTAHLAMMLRERRIDLAIGVGTESAADLESHPLFEDELLFVVSRDHAWTDGRALSAEEIRGQPLILYQRSSSMTQLVNTYFKQSRIDPLCTMEIASITAIKAMVEMKLGVSVLAPWTADPELSRGMLKMRPLGARVLKRRWTILHSANRRLGHAEEKFCALCRARIAGMRLDRKDLPEAGRIRSH